MTQSQDNTEDSDGDGGNSPGEAFTLRAARWNGPGVLGSSCLEARRATQRLQIKRQVAGRLELVELPIAGLISDRLASEVAQQASTVLEGFLQCGCKLNNPNMQLTLAALVVIPELRISDLGLVDVTRFDFIPFVESFI